MVWVGVSGPQPHHLFFGGVVNVRKHLSDGY